jgi:hypothetical protein
MRDVMTDYVGRFYKPRPGPEVGENSMALVAMDDVNNQHVLSESR